MTINRILLATPLVGLIAACQQTGDPNTVAGATIGAVAGAAIADDNELEGALAGAVVGGIAGNLLGRSQRNPDQCVYEDRYGNRYVADCP